MTPTRSEILRALEALGNRYPDMRFGQLVVNVANWAAQKPDATWDVEDDDFLTAARHHLEQRTRAAAAVTAAIAPDLAHRPMETDSGSPQSIASLRSEQEAAALVDHLNALGIEAHSWGTNLTNVWPEVPSDIRVVVRQSDVERAKQALADFHRGQPELNWDEIDVGAPE